MREPDRILAKERLACWRRERVPISNFFELTPRCNFDCKMCYVHLTPEQMGQRKELTTEQWLRIVDEAVEAGMLYCVLTGGECMLHEGFWQIYDRILESGVVLSVNTNGWALTDADIARFRENPPTTIRITLYGASEESYERATGRRAFGKVLENIRKLKAAGLSPKLAATLTRYNQDDYEALNELCRGLKLRLRYTYDLFEPEEDVGRDALSAEADLEAVLRAEELSLREMNLEPVRNEPINELPVRLPDDPNYRGMVCGAGRISFAVRWDGELVPCFNVESKIYLQEHSLREAWAMIRETYESYLMPVECRDCKLLPICSPCPYFRHDPKDPGHCNPRRCRLTVERYNRGLSSLERPMSPEAEDVTELIRETI